MKWILSLFLLWVSVESLGQHNHSAWDALLKKHVTSKGVVDYGGFKKDEKILDGYLAHLSQREPQNSASSNEQLAYWINAYNAFTVKLVLTHLDKKLTSIKDIGSKFQVPFVNTPWDVKFIKIGGKEMDLNNIEHGIIRKKFNDPRIHFALVCAAVSCPPLRAEAFTSSQLNRQLDDQGVRFLNDPTKNLVKDNKAVVSKLFSWYGGDFKNTVQWVNKYSKNQITSKTKITYMDYDWALNGSY